MVGSLAAPFLQDPHNAVRWRSASGAVESARGLMGSGAAGARRACVYRRPHDAPPHDALAGEPDGALLADVLLMQAGLFAMLAELGAGVLESLYRSCPPEARLLPLLANEGTRCSAPGLDSASSLTTLGL